MVPVTFCGGEVVLQVALAFEGRPHDDRVAIPIDRDLARDESGNLAFHQLAWTARGKAKVNGRVARRSSVVPPSEIGKLTKIAMECFTTA